MTTPPSAEAPVAHELRQFIVLDGDKPVGSLTQVTPILPTTADSVRYGTPTYRLTVLVPIHRAGQQGHATLEADIPGTSLADALRKALPAARAMAAQGAAEATARGYSASVGGILIAGTPTK